MIEQKFWKPSVTTQYKVCPIPFHMDTYRGCTYGCKYCFARDFIQFARRNTEHKSQCYLVGNDPAKLAKWIERTNAKDYDYSKADEVAFKERIPLKIGATADPFPLIERETHITHDCLQALQEIDYPIQISTKNPAIFAEYADDFKGANIAFSISCSFADDETAKAIEPNAPAPSIRIQAARELTEKGFTVYARIQPFIHPYCTINAENFFEMFAGAGIKGVITEGLKIRVILPETEKKIYSEMGQVLGIDILDEFKNNGIIEGGDREYNENVKNQVLTKFSELAHAHGMQFYNGDNCLNHISDNCECCGTAILRNHKIWGGANRVDELGTETELAKELGKCKVNFTRSKANKDKTIEECCKREPMQLPLF